MGSLTGNPRCGSRDIPVRPEEDCGVRKWLSSTLGRLQADTTVLQWAQLQAPLRLRSSKEYSCSYVFVRNVLVRWSPCQMFPCCSNSGRRNPETYSQLGTETPPYVSFCFCYRPACCSPMCVCVYPRMSTLRKSFIGILGSFRN